MPHFSAKGNDTYICQVCASIHDSVDRPPAWRPDITGSTSAGNVCPSCIRMAHCGSRVSPNGKEYGVCRASDGRVVISGKCRVTGNLHVMRVPYSLTDTHSRWDRWRSGTLVQHAFPEISAEDREFLISGTSPKGWKALFGDEE